MKTSLTHAARLGALLGVLLPLGALAQSGPGPGGDPGSPGAGAGGGRHHGGARRFDPSTVTTIQGQITDVQRHERRGHEGVHLTVTSGQDTYAVLLGPSFYVDQQPVKLAKGDLVQVKGSKLELRGRPAIVAQEVRRGNDVLALRDASGVPLWRGQGPRANGATP